jgi:DNA-binding winged helix-turn-helix (wHTH) protein
VQIQSVFPDCRQEEQLSRFHPTRCVRFAIRAVLDPAFKTCYGSSKSSNLGRHKPIEIMSVNSMKRRSYRFDRFTLIPDESRLRESGLSEDVHIGGKCFDVLVALVQSQGRVLSRKDILNNAWGSDVHIEEGNVDTQISALRKVLDHDENSQRLIKTVRGKGFRFEAVVSVVDSDLGDASRDESNSDNLPTSFEIESHRFVPTYIGNSTTLPGVKHATKWGKYQEINFDGARLCVTELGIGVWHIREALNFSCLTDLAFWRRDGFRSILRGEHPIGSHTAKIMTIDGARLSDLFDRFAGKFEYALSVFALRRHTWLNRQLKPALKLISCPRILIPDGKSKYDPSSGRSLELEKLESDFEHPDSREFGVLGTHFGYASWAGVSYYGFGKDSGQFVETMSDFEIAVQSIWIYCHWVRQLAEEAKPADLPALKSAASTIRNEIRRLEAIGPNDPTEVRMMCEAVLATSRIRPLAEHALELISALTR